MIFLSLPDRKCKFCKHLDSQETKAYSCRDSERCPAQAVAFVVDDKVKLKVKEFRAAQFESDVKKQAEILVWVAEQSQSFAQRFNDLLMMGDFSGD